MQDWFFYAIEILVPKKLLVIAGTHGVEPQSTFVAKKLAESFSIPEIKRNYPFSFYRSEDGLLTIIPDLNRYGLENSTRTNENGVDLNRNMPSKNWSPKTHKDIKDYYPGPSAGSEAQTQALAEIIRDGDFYFIISMHTTHFISHPTPAQLNFDGFQFTDKNKSEETYGYRLASSLAKDLKLPLTMDIGYECFGTLGSFCKELNLPESTIEFPDEESGEELWSKHKEALCSFIQSVASQV